MRFLNDTVAARRRYFFYCQDSSGSPQAASYNPLTNGTGSIRVTKGDGTSANAAGTWTMLGSSDPGLGYYEAPQGEQNTLCAITIIVRDAVLLGGALKADDNVYAVNLFDATAAGLANLDTNVGSRAAPGASMNLAAGAVNAAAVASAALVAGSFAAGAITANAIATGAITVTKFAAGAIDSTVAPNLDAAVASRVAAGAPVTLADASLTAAKFGAGAINSTVAPNLDVAVSSRAAPGANMALVAGAVNAAAIGTAAIVAGSFAAGAINTTVAPNLDTNVGSRASQSSLDSDNASLAAAIGTRSAPGDQMNLASGAIASIVSAFLSAALGFGRTVQGVFRRMDDFMTGEASGLDASGTVVFKRPDGSTPTITLTRNLVDGTRTQATVGGD